MSEELNTLTDDVQEQVVDAPETEEVESEIEETETPETSEEVAIPQTPEENHKFAEFRKTTQAQMGQLTEQIGQKDQLLNMLFECV